MYKKSLSNVVTHINTTNRRVCGINIKDNNALLIILYIYMPCDNYSTYDVDNAYSECIDFIDTLYLSNDCDYFITTDNFNTCFSRDNAHTKCLNTFVNKNNLELSWDHPLSIKDFTYNNLSLNHFSCIYHFIVTRKCLRFYY